MKLAGWKSGYPRVAREGPDLQIPRRVFQEIGAAKLGPGRRLAPAALSDRAPQSEIVVEGDRASQTQPADVVRARGQGIFDQAR
jgi:hypothetical protein